MEPVEPVEAVKKEPVLNVPPLTLAVTVLLAGFFAALQKADWQEMLISAFGFVPAAFGHDPAANCATVLSYALLHFGWPHILMNGTGLLAFGSGVERLAGRSVFCAVLLSGCVTGSLGFWALHPDSAVTLGGASAGVSALFGAALPLLMKRRDLMAACAVFVVTNVLLGNIEFPGQEGVAIAWQSHLFGFFTGLLLMLLRRRKSV